jgi:hypothetical protein
MKVTKRAISASARNSQAYQQMLADKEALRNYCAGLTVNDKSSLQSVSVR